MRVLTDWIWQMVRKWVWVLALVPTLTDLIATYIPADTIPPPLASLLSLIGTWQATAVFFAIGFVIAAFLVHRDSHKEIGRLQAQVDQIKNRTPEFQVDLAIENVTSNVPLVICLLPVSGPQNIEQLVQQQARHLEQKHQAQLDAYKAEPSSLFTFGPSLSLNPNYDRELKQYLVDYRAFLLRSYEGTLTNDRFRQCFASVRNVGPVTASGVSIALEFPPNWVPDDTKEHELILARYYGEEAFDPPKEPESVLRYDIGTLGSNYRYFAPTDTATYVPNPLPPNAPPTKNLGANTNTITYVVGELVPQQRVHLGEPFYVWLGDIRTSGTFQIGVQVYAAQCSEPQRQVIEIKIEI